MCQQLAIELQLSNERTISSDEKISKLQVSAKKYEDLQKEYEDLQKDHNDLRYTFNLQKGYTDVWRYNFYKENNNGHPACKPLSMMRRVIKTATKKEDIVLDPFMGGGSTAIACRQIKRHYIGFEVNQTYCDLANKQLSNLPTSLDSFLE